MITIGQIVRKPAKIDFHIHSVASAHKDNQKVKDGTAANINVLFNRLEQNEVNMAAITDHDVFDYSIYNALRNKVKNAQYLQRVLPGVEFTVCFQTKENNRPVHVITLFDDSDQKLVAAIADAIPRKDGKPDYDMSEAFSEDKYWNIIRTIGLNIVTIAHQKTPPSSTHKRKNDANSVGKTRYDEFLFVEYFEAYEYKNRRNELFNKNYAYSNHQRESLRFITGSDCHVWDTYPTRDANPDSDFHYTYLKCLPTFRGLAMAVTDISRIKTVSSFFSGSTSALDAIELTLNDTDFTIPLSPGINAIIGDNSIGKSSLLNALNCYRDVKNTVKKGQVEYLEKMDLSLKTTIQADHLLKFDGQGAIREIFERLNLGKAQKQLDEHFPNPVDPTFFKNFAMAQFRKYFTALKKSCMYQDAISALKNYQIPKQRPLDTPQSIIFDKEIKCDDDSAHDKLLAEMENIQFKLKNIVEHYSAVILQDDKKDFEAARVALGRVMKRHKTLTDAIKLEIQIANRVSKSVTAYEKKQKQIATDAQKALVEFLGTIKETGQKIANTVKGEYQLQDFTFNFDPVTIKPNINPVGNLQFVSKLAIDQITPALLSEIIDSLIGKQKELSTHNSSYESIKDAIKNYPEGEDDPLAVLETKVEHVLDTKLRPVRAINREGDNVYDELSQGYNAKMYFALMADRSVGDGIYIVDQPEDQISQQSIKESVLGAFRDIASARQVILITHNPQFVVNLDVDNVIFIGKENNKLFIRSGALEYKCAEYSVLNIIVENIEGGLDAIQKRIKRYEKANKI